MFLLICLPLSLLLAGEYILLVPRQYSAKAIVEFDRNHEPELFEAFQRGKNKFGVLVTLRPLRRSNSYGVPGDPFFFEIEAVDQDAMEATNIANGVSVFMSDEFMWKFMNEGDPRLTIVEAARPPSNPSRPNGRLILLLVVLFGVAPAIAGFVLLRTDLKAANMDGELRPL